jgi:hypothetical protein
MGCWYDSTSGLKPPIEPQVWQLLPCLYLHVCQRHRRLVPDNDAHTVARALRMNGLVLCVDAALNSLHMVVIAGNET